MVTKFKFLTNETPRRKRNILNKMFDIGKLSNESNDTLQLCMKICRLRPNQSRNLNIKGDPIDVSVFLKKKKKKLEMWNIYLTNCIQFGHSDTSMGSLEVEKYGGSLGPSKIKACVMLSRAKIWFFFSMTASASF